MPKRIQLRRTRGWRKPEGAVVVSRPTIWGNPWSVKMVRESGLFKPEAVRDVCVKEFRGWLTRKDNVDENSTHEIYRENAERRRQILERLHELRGKDLCCWCSPSKACHADVLLELANAE